MRSIKAGHEIAYRRRLGTLEETFVLFPVNGCDTP